MNSSYYASFGFVLAAGIAASSFGCSASDAPASNPQSGGAAAVAGAAPAAGAPSSAAGVAGVSGVSGAASGGSSNAGAAGASTTGSSGAASGGAGGAGTAPSGACPTDATFCSGFEDSALPTGAVYKYNAAPGDWSRDFAVDSAVFHSGKSALRVKSDAEGGLSGAYRMLAVPTPATAFWVRFYIQQTELDIGGNDHNVFASASASDDPNAPSIEFAEDVGVAFNTSDDVRWPTNYGRLTSGGTNPFTLPKGVWHCVEISFDAQGREQKLFLDSMPQIDAMDYPKAGAVSSVKNFKFGFNQLHGPTRKVYYDDVVVGPSRSPCF